MEKKDKKSGKGRLPGKSGKMIITRDHMGRLVPGKKEITRGLDDDISIFISRFSMCHRLNYV